MRVVTSLSEQLENDNYVILLDEFIEKNIIF